MKYNIAIAIVTIVFLSGVVSQCMETELLRKQFEKVEIDSNKVPSLKESCLKKIGEKEVSEEIIRAYLLSEESSRQLPEIYAQQILSVLNKNAVAACTQEIVNAAASLDIEVFAVLLNKFIESLDKDALQAICEGEQTPMHVKDAIIKHLPMHEKFKSLLFKKDKLISWAEVIPYQTYITSSIAYSKEKNCFAIGYRDGALKIVKNSDNRWHCAETLSHGGWINDVAWSGSGNYLAVISNDNRDREIKLYGEIDGTWQCIEILTGHSDHITSMATLPGKDCFATSSRDSTVKIWNLIQGRWQCIATLTGHTNWIRCVEWSPTGDYLATASDDATVKIWCVGAEGQWQCIKTIPIGKFGTRTVQWSADGHYLVTGDVDNTLINIWACVNDQWQRAMLAGQALMNSAAWSCKNLAVNYTTKIMTIWNLVNGQWQNSALIGHTDIIWSMEWSPDGVYLATGSRDRTVRIWTIVDGTWQCIMILTNYEGDIHSVKWSADGNYLVTRCKNEAKIWDTGLLQKINQYTFSYDEIKQLQTMSEEEMQRWLRQIEL